LIARHCCHCCRLNNHSSISNAYNQVLSPKAGLRQELASPSATDCPAAARFDNAALLLPCSFAQVVMWLEALAAQKLPDPLRDASCRFTSQDGVWRETLRALGGPGHHTAAGPGSELDPDAVSRDQLKLAVANQENDKKLAAWAWRLVRAGATPGTQCHGRVLPVLFSYFMGVRNHSKRCSSPHICVYRADMHQPDWASTFAALEEACALRVCVWGGGGGVLFRGV